MNENELSELYHINSELSPETTGEFVRQMIVDNPLGRPMTYAASDNIALTPAKLKISMEYCLANRVSSTRFRGAVDFKALSTLLAHSLAPGELRDSGLRQRPYPSAGGLYPVSTYLIGQNIEGIGPGIFHVNPDKAVLEIVSLDVDEIMQVLADAIVSDNIDGKPSFYLLLVGNLELVKRKYGDRGYRFMLLEAGHIAQNLGLLATALKIEHLPLGGFCEALLEQSIGIRKQGLYSLHLMAFGKS